MENAFFLPHTTDQCRLAERTLAKYRLRIMESPKLPLERKPSPDKDGPDYEPNLWMWVNPNIMCPLGTQEAPKPSKKKDLASMPLSPPPPVKDEESNCSEATVVESLPSSSRTGSSQKRRLRNNLTTPLWLSSPLRKSQKLWQTNGQERRSWPRPPLNYSHLIALALRNSSPCGLNVQEIYNFTQQHFPFFWTAPDGWKNTIRHNLCCLGSFEKVPVSLQDGANSRPRSSLWRLTEEGHRRFQEETRALASTRRESIQQCMSQPDVMTSLFDL
uniref:Forkhead box R2 n=1 Tax=Loxodonta africana TaxID=9785 RepID=G3U8S3_LOXAF